jgi:hypothetical protein
MREAWLNGWSRDRDHVSIGGSLRCAGCGGDLGVTCVAIDSAAVLPSAREPEWPFDEDGCPLCLLRTGQPRDPGYNRCTTAARASSTSLSAKTTRASALTVTLALASCAFEVRDLGEGVGRGAFGVGHLPLQLGDQGVLGVGGGVVGEGRGDWSRVSKRRHGRARHIDCHLEGFIAESPRHHFQRRQRDNALGGIPRERGGGFEFPRTVGDQVLIPRDDSISVNHRLPLLGGHGVVAERLAHLLRERRDTHGHHRRAGARRSCGSRSGSVRGQRR